MALALLRPKPDREGYLKKASNAKGKDEVRGNWQERWFVLKGHTLDYYKKKEDSSPKGTIDLRAAKVDPANAQTGKEFTIRIAQSKQVFSYLQCANEEDCQAWLQAIRKGAGYKDEALNQNAASPKTQFDSFCSFTAFYRQTAMSRFLDPLTAVLDLDDQSLKLFKDSGEVIRVHSCGTVAAAVALPQPEEGAQVSPTHKTPLWPVNADFKSNSYSSRKVLYFASKREADEFARLLSAVAENNFNPIDVILRRPPLNSSVLQMRSLASDSKWEEFWTVVVEERLLLFHTREALVPYRVAFLPSCEVRKLDEGGHAGLVVESKVETFVFRFSQGSVRDAWLAAVKQASVTLSDAISQAVQQQQHQQQQRDEEAKAGPSPALARLPTAGGVGSTQLAAAAAAAPASKNMVLLDTSSAPTFLASWGEGEQGQLGHRSKDMLTTPRVVSALARKFVRQVAAGEGFCGAVTNEGHVFMWGSGDDCQLGLGENLKHSASPYLVTALRNHGQVAQLACGRAHVLAISVSGEVFAWGSSQYGQLGLGDTATAAYPKPVPGVRGVAVAAGRNHSAVIGVRGELWVWGDNRQSQLGLLPAATGGQSLVLKPLIHPMLQGLGAVRLVALGGDSSAVIMDRTSKVLVFGANDSGQLGLGDVRPRVEPTPLDFFSRPGMAPARQISMGARHAMAVLENGQLYSWGAVKVSGLTAQANVPVLIPELSDVAAVTSGATHNLAVTHHGRLYALGANLAGQLGNGHPQLEGLVEVDLDPSLRVTCVAAGANFSLAVIEGEAPMNITASASDPGAPARGLPSSGSSGRIVDPSILRVADDISVADANKKIGQLLSAMNISEQAPPSEPPPDAPVQQEGAPGEDGEGNASGGEEKGARKPGEPGPAKKKKGKWKEVADPKTGRTYYYHTRTRETRWRKPKEDE